jgi:hypothetical protein
MAIKVLKERGSSALDRPDTRSDGERGALPCGGKGAGGVDGLSVKPRMGRALARGDHDLAGESASETRSA